MKKYWHDGAVLKTQGVLVGQAVTEGQARRIVACLNVCSAMDTEQLEARVASQDFDAAMARIQELEAKCSALTQALEYAYDNRDTQHEYDKEYVERSCGVHVGKPCNCHVAAIEKRLSAALGRCEAIRD